MGKTEVPIDGEYSKLLIRAGYPMLFNFQKTAFVFFAHGPSASLLEVATNGLMAVLLSVAMQRMCFLLVCFFSGRSIIPTTDRRY